MAMARHRVVARSHSIAIEPQPAPTSHSISPGSGASAASVAARTSRLVSWPSCSNASSGRPASARQRARAVAPATALDRDVLRSAQRRLAPVCAASLVEDASRGPPRCSSTVSRLGPQPARGSSAATRARRRAVFREDEEATAPARGARRSASSGRPCRLSVTHSASGQPSRAAARLKAPGCGSDGHLARGSKWRARVTPTPYHMRVAARQHDDPPAAPRGDARDRAGRAGCSQREALGRAGRHHREMALAADQQLGGLDQGARRRR